MCLGICKESSLEDYILCFSWGTCTTFLYFQLIFYFKILVCVLWNAVRFGYSVVFFPSFISIRGTFPLLSYPNPVHWDRPSIKGSLWWLATYFHCWWSCPHVASFWAKLSANIYQITKCKTQLWPELILLNLWKVSDITGLHRGQNHGNIQWFPKVSLSFFSFYNVSNRYEQLSLAD